jgi:hypothetical protein
MHIPGEKPNEQLNTDQRPGVNHAPGRWCAFDPKACCNNLLQRHRPGNCAMRSGSVRVEQMGQDAEHPPRVGSCWRCGEQWLFAAGCSGEAGIE